MKKKLIVLLMFLLSCLAIYSNDVNSQNVSNSFSSQNFLKKLTSLTPENSEKTEKFANYLKNEMERKKEVSYLIKVDKDEKKITVIAENGEILFDEAVPEEVINSFPTYQTKIKEVEEKGLIKTYVEASYMVKTIRKPNFKNEKIDLESVSLLKKYYFIPLVSVTVLLFVSHQYSFILQKFHLVDNYSYALAANIDNVIFTFYLILIVRKIDFSNKYLLFLGRVSFELYMIHVLVISIFGKYFETSRLNDIIFTTSVLIVSIFLAWLINAIIKKINIKAT